MDITLVMLAVVSCGVFGVVIELVRRGRLKEKYSLLWLVATFLMVVFSLSRDLLQSASFLFGIKYPPSFIFLIAFIFLVIINIYFSTVLSGLSEKNKTLAQEIALLRESACRRPASED